MDNQNSNTGYASSVKSPVEQGNETIQQSPYQVTDTQYVYNYPNNYSAAYNQTAVPEDGGTDVFGIMSAVFSSVGLACCSIQFSIIGVIMGIVALVRAKKAMRKSSAGMVGLILGAVSLVLYVLFILAYFSLIVSSISQLDRLLY